MARRTNPQTMNPWAIAAHDFATTGQLDDARRIVSENGISCRAFIDAYSWHPENEAKRLAALAVIKEVYGLSECK